MDLDDVLKDIGEYGRYQRNLLFFVFLPCMFPCAFHAYDQLFMIDSPPHCCQVRNQEQSISNNLTCVDGYDFDIPEEETVFEELLICESSIRVTLALVLFGIAGFIGSYIFGYLQDRVGRQPSFFLYLAIECVFGLATAVATDFRIWLLLRFGVGFTIPAILSTPYVLPIELVGPEYRTRCTILSNIAYSFGLVALSGVVYFFQNWRLLSVATSTPFLLYFVYWRYMPESPRWLLASGRFEKAIKILVEMAETNGKHLTELHVRKLQDKFSGPKKEELLQKSKQYGALDLFTNKYLRSRTVIITFIWFTNTSVYVGLSYYAPVLSGDKYLNFFLAGVVELPTYFVLWPTMERYGRREILCSSMLLGGIACLLTILFTNNDTILLILYCIGKMGISSSYVVLPLFVSELYPTVVRGIGMSVGTVAGMLGPIFIPLVNYWGIGSCLPLVVMGALLVFGGISSLYLPETKNSHLPENIFDDRV